MNSELPKWLSFYIYLPWTGNEFLANFLPQMISALKAENQIKRFFFIRYIEGGYHLRLRLQMTADSDYQIIEKQIKNTLENFRKHGKISSSQIRLARAEYSREEQYFGETRESVYAELVNEQTSYLSMQMLAGAGERNYALLLKNAASLYWIFALSSFDEKDFNQSLAESHAFAERNKAENRKDYSFDSLLRNVSITVERTSEAIVKLPHLVRAASLLKRLKLCKRGRFAATHGIHLYCNKLGFSMSQESEIYTLLSEIPKLSSKIEK
ncbi:MAG: thiopeptide-type bacteriocin biosynthesis protein [Pyrinomonadaceae bacterium]